MIAKCACDHCGENIEFSTEEFLSGNSIPCPHCGKETFLSVSPKSKPTSISRPKPAAPIIPPQQFKASAKSKVPNIQSFIPWAIVLISVCINLFLFHRLSTRATILQRTQIALDMAEKSEAELKSSVKTADITAKDNVSELAAEGRQALSGIYYCQQANYRNEIDLRSDGSMGWLNDSSGQKLGASKWTTDGDTITIDSSKFKIESSDLIDSRGNRWLHIRN
jgi:predicted  nucleic acid-binding Zn-ribbon protein